MNTNLSQSSFSWTERLVLLSLTAFGMFLCTTGVGKVAAAGTWVSVPGIGGSLLGVLVLAIVGARLLNISLPGISSDRQAIMAVTAVGLLKVLLGIVFRL